ncbi:molecular chaperone [Atlantibacter sp.]|uniref:fimbrial biogenesis chaperone n=1 Tax=Atlantibacter sp. TaxID=1903473 RepID=UPI0028B05716|nr:fimbria/pilus periplasmic chaperone [Atlantibacter sp.]
MNIFSLMKVLVLLLLTVMSDSYAGIVIGGTRLIFHGDKKEASLSVNNPDSVPYLIQSWIESESGGSAKSAFLLTPPLFRLDQGQKNLLRIENISPQSQVKETLYWLNVKAIPSTTKQQNALKIAIKNRIKMIYRPEGLNSQSPEDLADKLRWQRSGGNLTVNNPTPFYMNFMYVRINGQPVPTVTYVAPHSTASFALPAKSSGSQMSWALITDYGASGKEHQTSL